MILNSLIGASSKQQHDSPEAPSYAQFLFLDSMRISFARSPILYDPFPEQTCFLLTIFDILGSVALSQATLIRQLRRCNPRTA